MNEWISGIKLNYNGGPFSKMVRFLKFKFLIILKLNYNGGHLALVPWTLALGPWTLAQGPC